MTDLDVREAATDEEFVQEWGDDDDRLNWQVLGQLDDDEVLVRILEWLAEEKAGYVEGSPPTEVVGCIERETEKAILLTRLGHERSGSSLRHEKRGSARSDADRLAERIHRLLFYLKITLWNMPALYVLRFFYQCSLPNVYN